MTQTELVLQFIKQHGSILPAKLGGHPFNGGFFGSEISRVCRKLRKDGILRSQPEGRFERFFLAEVKYQEFKVLDGDGNVERIVKLVVK